MLTDCQWQILDCASLIAAVCSVNAAKSLGFSLSSDDCSLRSRAIRLYIAYEDFNTYRQTSSGDYTEAMHVQIRTMWTSEI